MRRLLPLVLLLVGCASGPDDETPVGSTAPDFKVETLSVPSSSVSLAKRRGKAVLIDYWAMWCGPCKQISPHLEAIYERHRKDGLEAMALTNEARELVALVEKRIPHKMPVYIDTQDEAYRRLGIQGLPTIMVIDRKGCIVLRSTGFNDPDAFAAQVEDAVEKALKE